MQTDEKEKIGVVARNKEVANREKTRYRTTEKLGIENKNKMTKSIDFE